MPGSRSRRHSTNRPCRGLSVRFGGSGFKRISYYFFNPAGTLIEGRLARPMAISDVKFYMAVNVFRDIFRTLCCFERLVNIRRIDWNSCAPPNPISVFSMANCLPIIVTRKLVGLCARLGSEIHLERALSLARRSAVRSSVDWHIAVASFRFAIGVQEADLGRWSRCR